MYFFHALKKPMPYRRTSVAGTRGRTAGTYKRGQRRGRPRASIATRARYQRSAAAQSRQISALARMAVRNSQILRSQRTYTDYYINGSTDATFIQGQWKVWSVLDPISWLQTLRQNSDADNAQNAFVRNMFFQYTSSVFKLQNAATVTLMLVSVRPNAAAFVPSTTSMGNGQEYQDLGFYSMPVVNSQLLRVRWSKTFVVQTNALNAPSLTPDQQLASGDPSDSYARGSCNMAINTTFRSPSMAIAPAIEPQSWSTLTDAALLPSQRLYFMAYYRSVDTENAAGLTWSAKFTVITSN